MSKPPLLLAYLLSVGFIIFNANASQKGSEVPLNALFLRGYTHNVQEIYDIIRCESGGRADVCNASYGCDSGMGLFQLIPSTLKYCEEKLGRDLDAFNEQDNYDCGIWLWENEGNRHWKQSSACWGAL